MTIAVGLKSSAGAFRQASPCADADQRRDAGRSISALPWRERSRWVARIFRPRRGAASALDSVGGPASAQADAWPKAPSRGLQSHGGGIIGGRAFALLR